MPVGTALNRVFKLTLCYRLIYGLGRNHLTKVERPNIFDKYVMTKYASYFLVKVKRSTNVFI